MNKILLIPVLLFTLAASAQVNPNAKKPGTKTPGAVKIEKWKPPVVKTYLAKFTGSNAVCSAAEGKQIISLPLRIVDAQNKSYAISSYQIAYKRLAVKEDEATGVVTPTTDLVAQRFTETPITGIWKTSIEEQLQKGEELFFFDIIVSDGKGHRFFAPELKLTIQ